MRTIVQGLLVAVALTFPHLVYASDTPIHEFKSCSKTWKLVKKEWGEGGSTFLLDAREYMSHCSTEIDRQQRTRLLLAMGEALLKEQQYQEAIPILQQCERQAFGLNGENAACWEKLGEAADYLGWCDAAATGFKAAIEVPTTDNLSSASHKLAVYIWEHPVGRPGFKCSTFNQPPAPQTATFSGGHFYGTAFFISASGLLLTNDHVVKNCTAITLGSGTRVQLLSRDPKNDLALLKVNEAPPQFVRFRSGEPARVGEPVLAFGFPLPGALSSGGIATNGIVSSLSGFRDDPRTLQFSAAIQPGNSGGPLFDSSGHVIGVVEAKLDALEMAKDTGIIPENVGFAIQWAQIRGFLESEDVIPIREVSDTTLSSRDIASFAQQVTVAIDCAQ